jgi:hypothetical protein
VFTVRYELHLCDIRRKLVGRVICAVMIAYREVCLLECDGLC